MFQATFYQKNNN